MQWREAVCLKMVWNLIRCMLFFCDMQSMILRPLQSTISNYRLHVSALMMACSALLQGSNMGHRWGWRVSSVVKESSSQSLGKKRAWVMEERSRLYTIEHIQRGGGGCKWLMPLLIPYQLLSNPKAQTFKLWMSYSKCLLNLCLWHFQIFTWAEKMCCLCHLVL